MATTRDDGRSRLDQLPRQAFACSHLAPQTSTDGEAGSSSTPVLNPRFVETLMGFPIGWTGFAHSATRWSRYRLRLRSELSRLAHWDMEVRGE